MSTKNEVQAQMMMMATKAFYARERGDHISSAEHWREAATLAETLGDIAAEATFMFEVGVSQYDLRDSQAAIRHHEQALTLWSRPESPDTDQIASVLYSLALDYQQAGQLDRARQYAEEALARGPDAKKILPKILFLLATFSEQAGETEAAIAFFERAAVAVEALGFRDQEARANAARLRERRNHSESTPAPSEPAAFVPADLSTMSLPDLFRTRRAIVFAGAGVSIPPPAGLPDWTSLRDELVRACARGDSELLQHVSRLTGAPMYGRAEEKGIIPELVMSKIKTVRPDYATIFEGLKEGTPNANHRYLAQIAAAGYCRTIVTTNFDTYIERALDEAGVPYQTYIDPLEDFPYFYSGSREGVQLLKLHGCITRPDTITATVEQEASGLLPAIRRALLQLLSEHVLVFWGYSGADLKVDLDYLGMASLHDVALGFIWSFHATVDWREEPSPYVRELASLYGPRAVLGHNLLPAGFDELLNEASRPSQMVLTSGDYDEWKRETSTRLIDSLSDWANRNLSSATGGLIYGSLLSHLGDEPAAQNTYERSHAAGDTAERMKAGLALGTLALQRGEVEAALHWFQQVTKSGAHDTEDGLAALQGTAEVYVRRGEIESAGIAFEMSITIAHARGLRRMNALCRTSLANTFTLWGRYKQAQALYEAVLEEMRVNGLEQERADTLLAYAEVLGRLGNRLSALEQIASAVRLGTMLGNSRVRRRARIARRRLVSVDRESTLKGLETEAEASADRIALVGTALLRAEDAAVSGDQAGAEMAFEAALQQCTHLPYEAGRVHEAYAIWQTRWGSFAASVEEYDAAIAAYRAAGAAVDQAGAHEAAGYLRLEKLGDSSRASEDFEAAFSELRRSGADRAGFDLAFRAALLRRDPPITWDEYCAGIDGEVIAEIAKPSEPRDLAMWKVFGRVLESAEAASDGDDRNSALERFETAFTLAERINSDPLRTEVLIRRGHRRRGFGAFPEAMTDYRTARDLAADRRPHQDRRALIACWYGMGWCFAMSGDIGRALQTWKQSVDVASQQHLLSTVVSYAYSIGAVLVQARPRDALPFLKQARLAAERLGDDEWLAKIYQSFSDALGQDPHQRQQTVNALEASATLYRRLGNLDAAIDCLRKGADVARTAELWESVMRLLEHTVAVLLLKEDAADTVLYRQVLAGLAEVDAHISPSDAFSPVLTRLKAVEGGKTEYLLALTARHVKMPGEINNPARISRILELHQSNWARAVFFVYLTSGRELANIDLLHWAMRTAEIYLEDVDTLAALEPLGGAYATARQTWIALATYRRAMGLAAEIGDEPARLRILTALAEVSDGSQVQS